MSVSPAAPPALHIDVVSDVVCPWCFIGKRRLENALLELVPDIPVDINWRPYFLNPWIPRDGIDRQTYLETKFGSAERYAVITPSAWSPPPHSRACCTLPTPSAANPIRSTVIAWILWSRSATDPSNMKQRLMELYFSLKAPT